MCTADSRLFSMWLSSEFEVSSHHAELASGRGTNQDVSLQSHLPECHLHPLTLPALQGTSYIYLLQRHGWSKASALSCPCVCPMLPSAKAFVQVVDGTTDQPPFPRLQDRQREPLES